MSGNIIDGLKVSGVVKSRVKSAVEHLHKEGIQPCLATVLVGDDPASMIYVKNKQKAAAELGIKTRDHKAPANLSQNELLDLINLLNNDNSVHGILVQLPLPDTINENDVINSISPAKDVDGLTPVNAGLLLSGSAALKPCTPSGIIELFDYYNINLTGLDTVIVNRSNLVGKPLAILLLERNATVTICHSKTRDLENKLIRADLVITAVGNRKKFFLQNDMIKKNSIIIDVGTTRENGKLAGDVDFSSVKEKCSWITPVPGGVGPMTIAMLLKNTVTAASVFKNKEVRY